MGLKDVYKKARLWKRKVWDAKGDYKVSLIEKARWASKGFSVNESVWYDLHNNDYHEYVSEYERLKSREINSKYKLLLDDKLVFEEVFGKYVRVPKNYIWVKNGVLYGLHGDDVEFDNLIEKLTDYKKTVLKWNESGGGSGTYIIEAVDGQIIVNGKVFSEEEIHDLFNRKGNALLCEYITQSAFSAELYPNTTNTIRMVCARKKGQKKADLIAAIQRVGCAESVPVDNFSCGGFSLRIDLKTGELGSAVAFHGDESERMKKFDTHPDTGAQLKGRIIPNWNELCRKIVEVTDCIPYLNFIAWDVLLTDDGFCVIEGNASTGVAVFQTEGGVRDGEIGSVLKQYGIIK